MTGAATKAIRPADARNVEGTLRRLGARWEAPESYEITGADVWAAYSSTMKAAEVEGKADDFRQRIRQIVGADKTGGFLSRILDRELSSSPGSGPTSRPWPGTDSSR